jgi:hypothetical protein
MYLRVASVGDNNDNDNKNTSNDASQVTRRKGSEVSIVVSEEDGEETSGLAQGCFYGRTTVLTIV